MFFISYRFLPLHVNAGVLFKLFLCFFFYFSQFFLLFSIVCSIFLFSAQNNIQFFPKKPFKLCIPSKAHLAAIVSTYNLLNPFDFSIFSNSTCLDVELILYLKYTNCMHFFAASQFKYCKFRMYARQMQRNH